MKRSQLDELIRLITRQILKEYTSMSSSSEEDDGGDSPTKSVDDMTPAEKSRAERAERQKNDADIKDKQRELDSTKTQSDYFKMQVNKNKYDLISQQKALQAAKGARLRKV